MDERDFEGSQILERLAEKGQLDIFYEAVDRDDFRSVKKILLAAEVDEDTIRLVLLKMQDSD